MRPNISSTQRAREAARHRARTPWVVRGTTRGGDSFLYRFRTEGAAWHVARAIEASGGEAEYWDERA